MNIWGYRSSAFYPVSNRFFHHCYRLKLNCFVFTTIINRLIEGNPFLKWIQKDEKSKKKINISHPPSRKHRTKNASETLTRTESEATVIVKGSYAIHCEWHRTYPCIIVCYRANTFTVIVVIYSRRSVRARRVYKCACTCVTAHNGHLYRLVCCSNYCYCAGSVIRCTLRPLFMSCAMRTTAHTRALLPAYTPTPRVTSYA